MLNRVSFALDVVCSGIINPTSDASSTQHLWGLTYLVRLGNQAIPSKQRLIHHALVRETEGLRRGVSERGILRQGKFRLREIPARYVTSIVTSKHIIIIIVITVLSEQKNWIGFSAAKRGTRENCTIVIL